MTLVIIALLVCIDIEFKLLLIPIKSEHIAETINKIVLALSYSYIAAAIFHFMVIYYPHKKRQRTIAPFLENNLLRLKEKIRQCYMVVLPPFIIGKVYDRDEYKSYFSNTNLYENYIFTGGKSKLNRLQLLRSEIKELIFQLLTYQDYLDDETFNFLKEVAISNYITNDIVPNNEMCNDSSKNQDIIGESIFDLQEKAKKLQNK